MRYKKDVRRFGSASPFIHQSNVRFNLSHSDNFDPSEVITDGSGNITDMPLLRGKPCFARPERWGRGMVERRSYQGRETLTRCDTCATRSPGVFDACGRVALERIASSPAIVAANQVWEAEVARIAEIDAAGEAKGLAPTRWEAGDRMNPSYRGIVEAIEAHSGWTNVNDARVSADELERQRDAARRKNETRRINRARNRQSSLGNPQSITGEWLDRLDAEAARRLEILRDLQKNGRMRTVSRLLPEGLERTVDVWRFKTMLQRTGRKVTGKAIAEALCATGRDRGTPIATLTTTVYTDLKRIDELEKPTATGAIWSGNP